MVRNTDNFDYNLDYYHGFGKYYFNYILKTIISIGNINQEPGLILDYGCGFSHLKQLSKNKKNIIGYDIIPKLSEVDDYRKLKPSKIVISAVLEHLYLNEIENLLQDFLRMNPEAILLVSLPTENIISKLMMFFAGMSNAHDDHVSKYDDINGVIEKYYKPAIRKYLFFKMSQVTMYIPLKNINNVTN